MLTSQSLPRPTMVRTVDGTPPSELQRINPVEPVNEMEDTAEVMVLDSTDSQEENVQCTCNECNIVFRTKDELNIHINTNHMEMWYTCDICQYKNCTQGGLTRHMQEIHMDVRYGCNQCEYQATTQDNLTKHNQSKHLGVRYSCDQCEYQATQKSIVNKHKQSKHKA